MLLFACWRFVNPLDHSADLGLYDEVNYLASGVQYLKGGPPPAPDCGPLYSVWYGILCQFSMDRASAYYLSYAVSAIAPPLLIFALAIRFGSSAIMALGAALWFLWSQANLPVWPRVNHFCLVPALTGLWLASFSATLRAKLAILSMTALLMAYCRPEHAVTWLIATTSWVLTAGWTFKKQKWTRPELTLAFIVVICSVTALLMFGWPLGHGRGMMAFGQHFGIHWCRWTGSALNNWDDWQQILQVSFGPVDSLSQAAMSNPLLLGRHIAGNLYSLLTTAPHLLLPTWWHGDRISALAVLLVIALLTWHLRKSIQSAFLHSCCAWLLPVIMLPAAFASILLIYPRSHYLALPLALGLLGFVALFCQNPFFRRSVGALRQPFIAGLVTLFIAAWPPYEAEENGQPHLKVVKAFQALINQEAGTAPRILDAEGGFALYLEGGATVPHVDKQESFSSFLEKTGINAVVVSQKLLSSVQFSTDETWGEFVNHPEKLGFYQFPVAGTPYSVLVHNSLLHAPR